MITEIEEPKVFRDLRRVNILVGANGVGKTRTLERVNARGEDVLVYDGFGEGVHYTALPMRVDALLAAAAEAQVFVSTHSLETIRAFSDAMEDYPEDLALFRLEANNPYAVRYSAGQIRGALDFNTEMR